MRFTPALSLTVAVLLPLVVSQAGGPTITTPASVTECQPVSLQVAGGTGPYFLSIVPGGQASAAPLETLPNLEEAGSATWLADIASGTSITFVVKDSTGAQGFSQAVTIQPGQDDSCVNGAAAPSGGASGSATASASASRAQSSALSGATSAASSALSAASSAATGLSGVISGASSRISSATAVLSSLGASGASAASRASSAASSASSAATSAAKAESAASVSKPSSALVGAVLGAIAVGAVGGFVLV